MQEAYRPRVVVLCIGNPMCGDDGVGTKVACELEGWQLPDGVEVIDGGTGGLLLLDLISRGDVLIVVDAMRGKEKQEVGTITRIEAADLLSDMTRHAAVSLHGGSFAQAWGFAKILGRPLPSLVIYGVEPETTERGNMVLSSAVQAAVPRVAEMVTQECNRVLSQ